jgi:hypothetical protein
MAGAPAGPAVVGGVVSRRALFGRLDNAERVVRISAPAGSGKTVLVRSRIAEAGLAQRNAWVHVDSQEHNQRRFWIAVAGALRGRGCRVGVGAAADRRVGPGRLGDHRAAAEGSGAAAGSALAGDR